MGERKFGSPESACTTPAVAKHWSCSVRAEEAFLNGESLSKRFSRLREAIEDTDEATIRRTLPLLQGPDIGVHGRRLLVALKKRMARKGLLVPSSKVSGRLSDIDADNPLPGTTIVSCTMNRHENLLASLETWLRLPVDEIVLVDWSSEQPLHEILEMHRDPRLRVARVSGETKWILTYAFNVGLRLASYERIYKLDADIEVTADFLEKNSFQESEFVRGSWKLGAQHGGKDQKYINGSFGAFKRDLRDLGYYNEFIRTYGWDDSDLYERLEVARGLHPRYLDPTSVVHRNQDDDSRLRFQDVPDRGTFLGRFDPVELYIQTNKHLVRNTVRWEASLLQEYQLRCSGQVSDADRLTSDLPIPQRLWESAVREAISEIAVWKSERLSNLLQSWPALVELIRVDFNLGVPFEETELLLEPAPRERNAAARNEPAPSAERIELSRATSQSAPMIVERSHGGTFERSVSQDGVVIRQVPPDVFAALAYIQRADRTTTYFDTVSSEKDRGRFSETRSSSEKAADEIAPRVLVTTVYDESRDDRRAEYIHCIERNLALFDRLIVFYERSSGVLIEDLKRRLRLDSLPSQLQLVEVDSRPTFEELFTLSDRSCRGAVTLVANGDIVFDDSVRKLTSELISDRFVVLSRYEADHCGATAVWTPILLPDGSPNFFSADVWGYIPPRKSWFRADFEVGSFQCDSFLNYHLWRGGYEVYNPCLDVRAMHIHADDATSSEAKAVALREEIRDRRLREAVLVRDVPLSGVPWCTAAEVGALSGITRALSWYEKTISIEAPARRGLTLPTAVHIVAAARLASFGGYRVVVWAAPTESSPSCYEMLQFLVSKLAVDSVVIIRSARSSGRTSAHTDDRLSNLQSDDLVRSYSRATKEDALALPDQSTLLLPAFDDLSISLLLDEFVVRDLTLLEQWMRELVSQYDMGLAFDPFIEEIGWRLKDSQSARDYAYFHSKNSPSPDVSLVTSVYDGAEHMAGFLANVAATVLHCNGEVVIVEAASPGNEYEIFERFLREHPGIAERFRYIRLEDDPGLYECWRIGIEASRSRYVGNANVDDRRSPMHTLALLSALQQDPGLAGAATALRVTRRLNAPWYSETSDSIWFDHLNREVSFGDFYRTTIAGLVASQNLMHCMPIWKKSLHDTYGWFDESTYGTSADWAFWLKCAGGGERFRLLSDALGGYYLNEGSHNRRYDRDGRKELQIIRDFIGVTQDRVVAQ